jgi:hypothetical protein
MDEQHHHHHQATAGQSAAGGSSDDVRTTQVFTGNYPAAYPTGTSGSSMAHMAGAPHHGSAIAARRMSRADHEDPNNLFPDIPEAKKRKFILVEDNVRGSRLRVRVTLDGVDTKEIPDSFRKGASVFPRSYFPREMQSPPPSPSGSKFFVDDLSDGDDAIEDTEGRSASRRGAREGRGKVMVKVPIGDNQEGEVAIPRTRKAIRGNEVRLNDLGYRMAWLQSRVFAGRTVFLQRARKFFALIPSPSVWAVPGRP